MANANANGCRELSAISQQQSDPLSALSILAWVQQAHEFVEHTIKVRKLTGHDRVVARSLGLLAHGVKRAIRDE